MALGRVFLSAEWRNLVMLNYRVDPATLAKFVPHDTQPRARFCVYRRRFRD
jgi:hypothetical protein